MVILGVVGGIASGKSFISNALQELGACVLDADQMGHAVLAEADVRDALVQRWGPQVLSQDGRVDRKAVAKIVFGPSPADERELEFLEELTHPRIGQRLQQRMQEFEATKRFPVAVLDAPVMLKAGWNRFCDAIVFVEAPEALRLGRATLRGWTESDFRERERRQETPQQKRLLADYIIDNSGTPQETLDQIHKLWNQLTQKTPPANAESSSP